MLARGAEGEEGSRGSVTPRWTKLDLDFLGRAGYRVQRAVPEYQYLSGSIGPSCRLQFTDSQEETSTRGGAITERAKELERDAQWSIFIRAWGKLAHSRKAAGIAESCVPDWTAVDNQWTLCSCRTGRCIHVSTPA